MIDWSSLSPSDFEMFCDELLRLNGFENIEWYGKGGGDKGRDLVATRSETPLPGIRRSRSWVVQCRRYTKKTITKGELAELLAAAREHKPDVVLLMLTSTMSADVRDWLKTVQSEYQFEVYSWEERDLEQQVRLHGSKLQTKPKIVPISGKPILLAEMAPAGKIYMPDLDGEFSEVGFYLLNSYDDEKDRQFVLRFVEFLRHHDVQFAGYEEEEGSS